MHLPGSLVLLSNSDPYVARNDPRNVWSSVHVPRGKLIELVANADDLVARQADKDHPGVRFLRNYLKLSSTQISGPAILRIERTHWRNPD